VRCPPRLVNHFSSCIISAVDHDSGAAFAASAEQAIVVPMTPSDPASPPPSSPLSASRLLTWWFGLMAISGMAFGAFAERRPFGTDVLAHPIVVFFFVVGLALLALRFALRRPLPEMISDRSLVLGCLVGVVAFLIGNWFATHLATLP
jgi:hypothetical protein